MSNDINDINDLNRSIDNIRKEMLKDFFGGNQDLMNSTIKTSSTDGKSSKTTMTKKPQGGAAPAQGKPSSQSGAASKQGAANDTGAATSGATSKADEDKFAKATGPQKKPKQAKPEKTGMDDLNELVGFCLRIKTSIEWKTDILHSTQFVCIFTNIELHQSTTRHRRIEDTYFILVCLRHRRQFDSEVI